MLGGSGRSTRRVTVGGDLKIEPPGKRSMNDSYASSDAKFESGIKGAAFVHS